MGTVFCVVLLVAALLRFVARWHESYLLRPDTQTLVSNLMKHLSGSWSLRR